MQAIVLKRVDFREADQIITLLTRERGKINVLARGVKKIVSKNSAYLEPFFLVEAEFIPGKDVTHITKAIGLNSFKMIRADLQKMMAAQRVVSLTDKLLEENDADIPVFKLLNNWLETIETLPYARGYYLGYIVRLFGILGFTPVLDKCVLCGKSVITNKKAARFNFSPADGGIVCSGCLSQSKHVKVIEIYATDRNNWMLMFNEKVDKWPPEIYRTLERAVSSFVDHHSTKKLAILSQIL